MKFLKLLVLGASLLSVQQLYADTNTQTHHKNHGKTLQNNTQTTTSNVNAVGTTTQQTNQTQNTAVNDNQIVSNIQNKFAEKATAVPKINVISRGGFVILEGDLNNNNDAIMLIQIAEATPGVRKVDSSRVTVNGNSSQMNQTLSDSMVTARVKGTFIREKLFGNQDISVMNIKVETDNGIVHLSGQADNKMQIDNAIRLAKTVQGVKKVESTIEVKPTM